jgi:hypothetical protein
LLEDAIQNLKHGLAGLPPGQLKGETKAKIALLSAELASLLEPSRKELLKDLKPRGITQKQLAIKAWPEVHPDKAAARVKMWVSAARYPDGSGGDIAIRAAIRALSGRQGSSPRRGFPPSF